MKLIKWNRQRSQYKIMAYAYKARIGKIQGSGNKKTGNHTVAYISETLKHICQTQPYPPEHMTWLYTYISCLLCLMSVYIKWTMSVYIKLLLLSLNTQTQICNMGHINTWLPCIQLFPQNIMPCPYKPSYHYTYREMHTNKQWNCSTERARDDQRSWCGGDHPLCSCNYVVSVGTDQVLLRTSITQLWVYQRPICW